MINRIPHRQFCADPVTEDTYDTENNSRSLRLIGKTLSTRALIVTVAGFTVGTLLVSRCDLRHHRALIPGSRTTSS